MGVRDILIFPVSTQEPVGRYRSNPLVLVCNCLNKRNPGVSTDTVKAVAEVEVVFKPSVY